MPSPETTDEQADAKDSEIAQLRAAVRNLAEMLHDATYDARTGDTPHYIEDAIAEALALCGEERA